MDYAMSSQLYLASIFGVCQYQRIHHHVPKRIDIHVCCYINMLRERLLPVGAVHQHPKNVDDGSPAGKPVSAHNLCIHALRLLIVAKSVQRYQYIISSS